MRVVLIVLGVVAAIVAIVALSWGSLFNDYAQTKTFAPKYESVRRETFENSRAYNAGTVQNLRDAQRDYITAPAGRRSGLASTIVAQYGDYSDDRLPQDLKSFMGCLRGHQTDDYDCSPHAG